MKVLLISSFDQIWPLTLSVTRTSPTASSACPTARVRSSVIRGPVAIGAGATIAGAYLGPHTSIGDRVLIEGAEIEDSVILPGGSIRFVSERLQHSVLGRNAKLFRDFGIPKAVRLVAGDGTEIALA